MTSHTKTFEHESPTTGILGGGGDNTFGQESQSLRGLKSRARRILPHDTAVQQRLPHIMT